MIRTLRTVVKDDRFVYQRLEFLQLNFLKVRADMSKKCFNRLLNAQTCEYFYKFYPRIILQSNKCNDILAGDV